MEHEAEAIRIGLYESLIPHHWLAHSRVRNTSGSRLIAFTVLGYKKWTEKRIALDLYCVYFILKTNDTKNVYLHTTMQPISLGNHGPKKPIYT